MKKLTLAIAILGMACAETPAPMDTAADEAAIRDLIQRTEQANNASDSLTWVSLFEAGAVYMPPGMSPVTTESELREVADAGFSGYQTDIRIEPDEIVILGDWAFARSTVTGTVTAQTGGEPIRIDVKQLVIYHRQVDGSWKISRFMNNRNS